MSTPQDLPNPEVTHSNAQNRRKRLFVIVMGAIFGAVLGMLSLTMASRADSRTSGGPTCEVAFLGQNIYSVPCETKALPDGGTESSIPLQAQLVCLGVTALLAVIGAFVGQSVGSLVTGGCSSGL